MSLDEVNKKIGVSLRATLCMVNVQTHEFVTNDIKVHGAKSTRPLSRDIVEDITLGGTHARNETAKARAVDMLLPNEVGFSRSTEDGDLLEEMEKQSCFAMMGVNDYIKMGETGLAKSNEGFNSKHLPYVNHFVRGAQASFRLGRPTSPASSMVFVRVSGLAYPCQAVAKGCAGSG